MSKKRKQYSKAFKEQAVQLIQEGRKVPQLAKELGVTSASLYRWQREYEQYGKNSFPGNGQAKLTDQERRIRELEKALADAELERDILKKAVHIFSKSDPKSMNS